MEPFKSNLTRVFEILNFWDRASTVIVASQAWFQHGDRLAQEKKIRLHGKIARDCVAATPSPARQDDHHRGHSHLPSGADGSPVTRRSSPGLDNSSGLPPRPARWCFSWQPYLSTGLVWGWPWWFLLISSWVFIRASAKEAYSSGSSSRFTSIWSRMIRSASTRR